MKKKDITIQKGETPGVKEKRQRRAIPLLAESTSVGKGCKRARISRDTYYRWCKEPWFVKELEEAQKLVLKAQAKRLAALSRQGLDFIEELFNDVHVEEIVDEYENKRKYVNVPYLALKLRATDSILDRIGVLAKVAKVSENDNPDAENNPFEEFTANIVGVKRSEPDPPPEQTKPAEAKKDG